jgi:cysteinyl-tRNA synthetase
MELKLYDTLTREKRVFTPLDRANVRMYVCGPTVYDFAHIGNARPVIVFDVLFRLLRHIYGATHVTYVRNITDVDDKINARAAEEYPALPLNEAIRKVTEKTDRQFHEDVAALGCLPPSVEPRATEHIAEMRTLIERLVKSDNAYVEGDHVLFSVPSMPDYGALSKRPLDEMIAGARVEVAPYKRAPMDFVLWKPSKPGEPSWPSPCGITAPGRPGWHIECSAMSWKHLGETFDIHGGGIDLVFPHHENEIAQSRCAFHAPALANYWVHNGFLQVEGEKMAKSLGNFVTINELLASTKFGSRKWNGQILRFAMLQTHYRQPLDWTVRLLEQSEARLANWKSFTAERTRSRLNASLFSELLDALLDDLNTPAAFAIADRVVSSAGTTDRDRHTVYKFLTTVGLKGGRSNVSILADNVASVVNGISRISANDWENISIGVRQKPVLNSGNPKAGSKLFALIALLKERLDQIEPAVQRVLQINYVSQLKNELASRSPSEEKDQDSFIRKQIERRNLARANKDWEESDRIRDELAQMGVVVKDTKDGTAWELGKPPLPLVHDTVKRLIEERNEARKAKNFERVSQISQELKSLGFDLADNKDDTATPKERR